MSDATLVSRLDRDGVAAPPRSNGELVFDAPWQGRAFGMVTSLAEAGVFDYEEFRVELIAAIAAAEHRGRDHGEAFCYYTCWLRALERLLGSRGLLEGSALDERVEEFERRPHGHDHGPAHA